MDNLPKTWDDWIANFSEWQDRVGFDREWLGDFDLSIQFDWDRAGDLIEFGDYEGRKKWERSLQVPQPLAAVRLWHESHRSECQPTCLQRT